MASIDAAYAALHDLLDDEKHDDDCVLRCLRNDCEAEHSCDVCGDDDEGPSDG